MSGSAVCCSISVILSLLQPSCLELCSHACPRCHSPLVTTVTQPLVTTVTQPPGYHRRPRCHSPLVTAGYHGDTAHWLPPVTTDQLQDQVCVHGNQILPVTQRDLLLTPALLPPTTRIITIIKSSFGENGIFVKVTEASTCGRAAHRFTDRGGSSTTCCAR